MSYNISLRKKAANRLDEIAEQFENKREGLGFEFIQAFDKAIESLKENPLKFQVRYKNTRVTHLLRFGVGIHYIVENQTVFVLAIFYSKEDSKKWTID